MHATGKADAGVRLPELRQDLKLIGSEEPGSAARRWLIYDPLRHRYSEVDATTFEVLSLWRAGLSAGQLISAVETATGKRISLEDVKALIRFAETEYLVADAPSGDWRKLAGMAAGLRRSPTSWLVHNYLFFKVPLVHPQAFLQRTVAVARLLVTPAARWLFAVLGLAGLYLVSRQWDSFIATFADFLSMEGALAFGLAVVVVKILHELGHAYTAVHYGCRVPAMGVAFMVLTPILYTDVTDAWRLERRRKRLAIDAAGVGVELMVASFATFLWPFLPPGLLKGIVFAIATTSWIMSLVVNLNPFMRFDGYYILSDLVGIQNLQPRSFALAQWWLREFLFALGEPPPETLSPGARRWLVAYAFVTWVYRLALFLGIALIVYHFFFKVLGVVLFIVEIVFFVLRPIWREIMEWRARHAAIRSSGRSYVTLGVLVLLVLAAVTPWSGRVSVPVVVEPIRMARLYPPQASRIESILVRTGQGVRQGDVVGVLRSDALERELKLVDTRIGSTRVRLSRVAAHSSDREQAIVLQRELQALLTERAGLEQVEAELTLRAPISGRVVELSRTMHAGRMIGRNELIMVIADPSAMQARGYVGESDVARLSAGAHARLIFDDGRLQTVGLSLAEVAPGGVTALEIDDLSSVHGGAIDAVDNGSGRVVPVEAQFPVRFAIAGAGHFPEHRIRGIAVVSGQPESYVRRFWRQVMRVVAREGGM